MAEWQRKRHTSARVCVRAGREKEKGRLISLADSYFYMPIVVGAWQDLSQEPELSSGSSWSHMGGRESGTWAVICCAAAQAHTQETGWGTQVLPRIWWSGCRCSTWQLNSYHNPHPTSLLIYFREEKHVSLVHRKFYPLYFHKDEKLEIDDCFLRLISEGITPFVNIQNIMLLTQRNKETSLRWGQRHGQCSWKAESNEPLVRSWALLAALVENLFWVLGKRET